MVHPTKSRRIVVGVLVLSAVVVAAGNATFGGELMIERLHLPHTPWAKPLPGGPVRTFFGSDKADHQVLWAALQDVIDLDARTYSVHGWGGATWALDEALARPFQLYILSPAIWDSLKPQQRSFILGQVHDGGAGFIMLAKPGGELQPDLDPVLASKDDLSVQLTGYVTRAVPMKTLQMPPDFTARLWGTGRALWIGWADFSPYPRLGDRSWQDPPTPWPFEAAEDYALAAAVRIMLWTSQRDSQLSMQVSRDRIDGVTVRLSDDRAVDSVQVRMRDGSGNVLNTQTVRPRNEQVIELGRPHRDRRGRRDARIVDVMATRGDRGGRSDGTVEWVSAMLDSGSGERVAVTLDRETASRRCPDRIDAVTGTVTCAEQPRKRPVSGEIILQLIDAAGVSALVILPDPQQIRQVRVEKAGSKIEPTATDTRHNRYSHMMNTTITLAPIPAGGTRTLRFALWARPDRSNDDARKYEKAEEIVRKMKNDE